MCRRPVAADTPAFFEHGEVIHLDCHLGLMDAGAAVGRLLRERAERPLCAECLANALMITPGEAEVAAIRLRRLPRFAMRFDLCLGCGRRKQTLRALRVLRGPAAGRRQAGGAQ
ncbi:MAG: hypothetical protein FJ027_12295 [Candidatus Rokubacteria bacterium]|nr:hypothetical protein [Candidatus Rokubacteria bacterium]